MAGLSDRLAALREAVYGPRGKAKMAALVGVSDSVWGRYEAGTAVPGSDVLERLAIAMPTVGRDWLLSGEGKMLGVAESAAELDAAQPPAPAAQPAAAHPYNVVRTVEPGYREVSPEELVGDPAGRYLPVLGRIAAGPGFDTSEADAYLPRSAATWLEYRGGPAGAFAIRIAGDSMMPHFRSGDMVIADPVRHVQSGLACVRYLDEADNIVASLKMVRREGAAWVLSSLSGAVRPIRVPAARMLTAYAVRETLPRIVEKTHW